MGETSSFRFDSQARGIKTRFDEFIAWAEPGGLGGFDGSHHERYEREDPFFACGKALLPHSHFNSRSWFVKQEYLEQAAPDSYYSRARGDSRPEIKNPLAMIKPGRFLSFGKAYVNVYCQIRGVRSLPKATVAALIYLEKSLRDLNKGDNDPSNISHTAFHRAALAIQRSGMVQSQCFDTGKALEHLALLIQGGGRLKGDKKHSAFPGFKLINASFSFKSPIKSPPKFGKKLENEGPHADNGQLTSEEVASVGLAYRRALERFGPEGAPTFIAALIGLTLTTTSMRASELLSLRSDALYEAKDEARHRLRIFRPKIAIEQDVPISRKLSQLATEIFDILKHHSTDARAALAFYIKQSPDSFDGIHTLYIPAHIKPLLTPPYLTKEQAHKIINPDIACKRSFPQCLTKIKSLVFFIDAPGDIYGTPSIHPMVRICDIINECQNLGTVTQVPADANIQQYVSMKMALKLIGANRDNKPALLTLQSLFSSKKARVGASRIPRDAVVNHLLSDFKKSSFPHWPYTSKDRKIRLDEALAVHFEANRDSNIERGTQREVWWLPRQLSIQALGQWLSGRNKYPPILFKLTSVQIDGGQYPNISVQRTRRYHHTAALLAGASPLFANQLAGRQSGWQGEAYDYRSPREIVRQSIDTYDPDQGSEVIGPIADQAPSPKRIVERRIFLMEAASPKHVTEIGGCRSDWVLDPCDFHGDCVRCSKHVWRKGDQVRFQRLLDMHAEASSTILIGKEKLLKNPRLKSIEKHVRQQMETLDRCENIQRIEADDSIPIGTLVTFPAAPSAMSSTELRSRLRKAAKT